MRRIAVIVFICALPMMGCGRANSGAGVAPPQDELTQFLQDNPDIANAAEEEEDETDNK